MTVPSSPHLVNRRVFLAASSWIAASASIGTAATSPKLHVATNTYPWGTFSARGGMAFHQHTDQALAAIASTGIQGYEPIMHGPQDFTGLASRLKAHHLEMRSLYVNSLLHDGSQATKSIHEVLEIGRRAAEMGVKIIVTNPAPIRWGGTEDKSDEQLRTQAENLNQLGDELRKLGLVLAYHNHDSELRQGAREFHHMLTATDPDNVKLCLDAHWVYRGCGNSQIALFDIVEHYGDRIAELHLRQSTAGIWDESFSAAGDIDYRRLVTWLQRHEIRPHVVIEQAIEKETPHTMNVIEAHRESHAETVNAFSALATF